MKLYSEVKDVSSSLPKRGSQIKQWSGCFKFEWRQFIVQASLGTYVAAVCRIFSTSVRRRCSQSVRQCRRRQATYHTLRQSPLSGPAEARGVATARKTSVTTSRATLACPVSRTGRQVSVQTNRRDRCCSRCRPATTAAAAAVTSCVTGDKMLVSSVFHASLFSRNRLQISKHVEFLFKSQ